MTTYKVEIVNSPNDLAVLTSKVISKHLNSVLDNKDSVQIALSGGSTPAETYKLLGQEKLPWQYVDVFLGDERWVDQTNESSNSFLLRRTLFSSGPALEATFYPVPTTEYLTPDESAEKFARLLERLCIGKPPVFDLILLGLGDDGHTASLFPSTESLNVKDSWTTVGRGKGLDRITLTAPVLSAAKKVIFLVSGSSKQVALKRLLESSESTDRTPARLVQPDSEILVLADEAAAELL